MEQMRPLAGSERATPTGSVIGPADPTEQSTVSIYLHSGDKDAMQRVSAFMQSQGLTVTSSDSARRALLVAGTLEQLQRVFGVTLQRYDDGTHQFNGREGWIMLPESLHDDVVAVLGLDKRPQARPQIRFATEAATSYTPPQVAALYAFPSNVTGAGQTIAFIELGGGFSQSDYTAYFQSLGLTPPTVTVVPVDGATNSPGTDQNADGEVMLDVEVAGAVAPGAALVIYLAPNTDQGFIDAVSTAVNDTTRKPGIISISWGGAESTWTSQATTALNTVLQDAVNANISVCVASGDSGSSDGVGGSAPNVDFPASSPNVLACGGTSLTSKGTTITSEVVWNSDGGASGGGISDLFATPSWQANITLPTSANGGKAGRGVPDVASDADPNTGYSVRVDGATQVIGGTSAAAPLWAGLIALLNQSLGKNVGFVNPKLYAIAPDPLHDITQGNNGAYSAGPGWDACTGLGSPDGSQLLAALQT
jgi:kumamolisin